MLPLETPDLTALELLGSVAELGSLGRAASHHHLSQPAVSMRMTQLEQRLGLTLLVRDPSGTHLTAAGEQMMTSCRRVLAEVERMMATAEALRATQQLRLRVAASLTVAEHLVPTWLGTLSSEFPQLAFALDVTNSAGVVTQVEHGLVDIGFVEGEPDRLAGVESEVMGTDRLVVVVSAQHPWARRTTPLSGAELASTEIIVREPGSGTREILEAALAPFGGLRSRLALGATASILGAVRRGDGPAVLSELAIAQDVEAGRLVTVDVPDLDLTRSFRAIWLIEPSLAPLARRLLAIART